MPRTRTAQVETPQLSGQLGHVFPPLIALQACHIAQLTGTLRARNGARYVWVAFRDGEITAADSLEHEGLDALVEFAQWSEGRFEFVCGPPPFQDAPPHPFEWTVLEVCRRLDESRRELAS